MTLGPHGGYGSSGRAIQLTARKHVTTVAHNWLRDIHWDPRRRERRAKWMDRVAAKQRGGSLGYFAAYGLRAAAIVLLLHPVLAAADFIVPANAIVSLNGGTLDLGCTDLIVAGTLQIGSGQVLNARNVTIQSGGVLDGGSGAIELGGNWSNNGGIPRRHRHGPLP